MKNNISTILEKINNLKKSERVEALRQNDSQTMRTVLSFCFDPNIKWLLPKGEVPYNKNVNEDQRNMFYSQARTLYLYIEGGNNNLRQMRREQLFIQLLESIDPKDAELIVSIKDKIMPYEGITYNIVKKAFPELLP